MIERGLLSGLFMRHFGSAGRDGDQTANGPLYKVEMARLHEMLGVFDKAASASTRRNGGKVPNTFDTDQDSGAPRSEQATAVS